MRIPILIAALLAGGAANAQVAVDANSTVAPAPVAPTRPLATDRGYDKPSARTDAINRVEGPVTSQLNAGASANAGDQAAVSTSAQAQYDLDRRAYLDALVQHDAAVDRTDARYDRQQRAYADAMSVWRVQVQECQKGHHKACELPAPNVADYY